MENAERTGRNDLSSSDDIESQGHPLVNVLEQKCRALSPLQTDWCMYKVPEILRALNNKAYEPLVISIGPYHHGVVHNQEDLKLRYVTSFQKWTGKSFEDLVNFVEMQEEQIRSYYGIQTLSKFTRKAFAEMILMDAIFVVVLLLKWRFYDLCDSDDDNYRLSNLFSDLKRDLAILKNQLPLFILKELFGMVKTARKLEPSFLSVALAFWNVSMIRRYKVPGPEVHPENEIPFSSHFVDMLILYHAPTNPKKEPKADSNSGNLLYPRSITELHEAGIRLKKSTSIKFTDIHNVNGILEIPHIDIDHWTESYLRNIVAFEQCHCIEDRYVTEYISLMERLVNTPKDVELLIEKRILHNWLGDNNQVCILFNNLKKKC